MQLYCFKIKEDNTMANFNDLRGTGLKVELGGKTRTIKFDLNAFGELENLYGDVQAAMAELQKGKIKTIKIVLWAGLLHEEAVLDEVTGEPIKYNITPYQVGSWVDSGALPDIMVKLQQAMTLNLPEHIKKEVARVEAEEEAKKSKIAQVVLTPEEQKEEDEKNV